MRRGLGLGIGHGRGTLLPAPTDLIAFLNPDNSITLEWTDAAVAPDGYRIYRDGVLLDSVAQSVQTYDDIFSTIVIAGGGFGTKATAEPLYFNDFEDETVGDHASAGGSPSLDPIAGLTHTQTSGAWTDGVSNTRAHSGTKSLRAIYSQADGFPNLGVNLTGSPLTAYQGMWVYWERTAGAGGMFNFKFGRMGANAPYSGNPGLRVTLDLTQALSPYTVANTDVGFTSDTGPVFTEGVNFTELRDYFTADAKDVLGPDGWHFLEYLYRLSTPGVADGLVQIKVDGVAILNRSGIMTRLSGVTDPMAWIITPFDGADQVDPASTFHLYADEMLLDTSFARVVMTNNAVYASSTKFAPQPCTQWADGAIGIASPNWSNLPSGPAFAHVWDAENNYIGHYAVTVP